MKERILVSACLLGSPCRFDGDSRPSAQVIALKDRYELIPACPEVLGGLKIPHPPAEQRDGGVFDREGKDVTAEFTRGADAMVAIAKAKGIKKAILKSRSPSCGHGTIYDGTFGGILISGNGVSASRLQEAGVWVISDEELADFPQFTEGKEVMHE